MADADEPRCECCDAQGVPLKVYPSNRASHKKSPEENKITLCKLCVSTSASTWSEYPEQQTREALSIMRAICFVGNEILKEIRRRKS